MPKYATIYTLRSYQSSLMYCHISSVPGFKSSYIGVVWGSRKSRLGWDRKQCAD